MDQTDQTTAPPFDPADHPALAGLGERLHELAGDSSFQAGRDYFRKGRVGQAAVAGTTAHATVTGSTAYRVSLSFASELKPACSCPAHRRNKFCKHVVAVCTALLERPGDFVAMEPAPEAAERGTRARPGVPGSAERGAGGGSGAGRASRGSTKSEDKAALQAAGLETVDRLLEELAGGGLMTLGLDKAALLAGAGELVRALKLRRLGNLVLALQRAATAAGTGLEAPDFARLLVDLSLTRQASGAWLEGRAEADPRLAEDLLGKTWRESELEPVRGLELLELACTTRNEGDFRIETGFLVDLATAEVLTEKQITPVRGFTPRTRHRLRLVVEEGGLYPGVAPRRIRLGRVARRPLSAEHILHLLERAPDRVAELRGRLVERLGAPFGVVEMATLLRPAALVTDGKQVGAMDVDSHFLALEWPELWHKELLPVLPPAGDYAFFGLLDGDGPRPVLRCLAAVGALQWGRGPVYPAG